MRKNKPSKTKPVRGLVRYWGLLDVQDRALLCLVVNAHGELGYDVHQGLLPFVNINVATVCLHKAIENQPDRTKVFLRIIAKIADAADPRDRITWTLSLKAAKVNKKCSPSFDKGMRVPYVAPQKVTAGLKWSLARQAYVPDDDTMVSPMFFMSLVERRAFNGWSIYAVTCQKRHRAVITDYLLKECR